MTESNKSPLKKIKTKKHKWTRDEKVEVFKCYLLARFKKLPITSGTFDMWKERNPSPKVKMTPVTLSNQRRMFAKSLTLSEQKVMEKEVEAELKSKPNEDKSNETSQRAELTLIGGNENSQKGNSPCQTSPNEDKDKLKD